MSDAPSIEGLADLDRLKERSREIARSERSGWEPRCVARAFACGGRVRWKEHEVRFTMQTWIDLDHALSPLLLGRMPGDLDELEAAVDAFALEVEALTPDEAIELTEAMLRAVTLGFALRLDMRRPGAAAAAALLPDGFGAWLPIYAALVQECGVAPAAVKAMDVAEVFALLAGVRWNKGWEPAGTPYALRDLGKEE